MEVRSESPAPESSAPIADDAYSHFDEDAFNEFAVNLRAMLEVTCKKEPAEVFDAEDYDEYEPDDEEVVAPRKVRKQRE